MSCWSSDSHSNILLLLAKEYVVIVLEFSGLISIWYLKMSFTDHIAVIQMQSSGNVTFVTHCIVLENPFPPCGGSLEILRGSGDLKAKILRELLFFNVKFPGGVRGEIQIKNPVWESFFWNNSIFLCNEYP